MAPDGQWRGASNGEAGHAALLMLGVLAALLTGLLVLFGFGQALGAKGRAQRAAGAGSALSGPLTASSREPLGRHRRDAPPARSRSAQSGSKQSLDGA